jgi:hypothetical protein
MKLEEVFLVFIFLFLGLTCHDNNEEWYRGIFLGEMPIQIRFWTLGSMMRALGVAAAASASLRARCAA